MDDERNIEKTSRNNKQKSKRQSTKPKAHVYDNATNQSHAGSSSTFLPSALSSITKPKKSPYDMGEDIEEFEGHKIPDFIRKEFIRDQNLKRPDDPEYDPSKLDIPEELFNKLTPAMKQYWDIKKDHFDSVVLWRKGNWYIVFFHDITALNSVADKNPRTFHSEPGFFENRIDQYVTSLIKGGFKVVRVEQTETSEQFKERVKNIPAKQRNGKGGVVSREITGKYTKGTFLKPIPIEDFLKGKQDEDEELDTKYVLLYLFDEEQNTFGITYFDITTLKFFIGQFKDDSMR